MWTVAALLRPCLAPIIVWVIVLLLPSSRGRKVICAYSIEDIDQAFSTSKLKGYSSPFIGSRPGTVRNAKPAHHCVFFQTIVAISGRQKSH